MNDFVKATIDDMRGHGGRITQGPLAGRPALILTTIGAKTGRESVVPVNYSRDGDRYVIAATKGGSPTNPGWYHNLVANPVVTVEAEGDRFQARAIPAEGAERERLWENHVKTFPFFGAYPSKTTRIIPVIALERVG